MPDLPRSFELPPFEDFLIENALTGYVIPIDINVIPYQQVVVERNSTTTLSGSFELPSLPPYATYHLILYRMSGCIGRSLYGTITRYDPDTGTETEIGYFGYGDDYSASASLHIQGVVLNVPLLYMKYMPYYGLVYDDKTIALADGGTPTFKDPKFEVRINVTNPLRLANVPITVGLNVRIYIRILGEPKLYKDIPLEYPILIRDYTKVVTNPAETKSYYRFTFNAMYVKGKLPDLILLEVSHWAERMNIFRVYVQNPRTGSYELVGEQYNVWDTAQGRQWIIVSDITDYVYDNGLVRGYIEVENPYTEDRTYCIHSILARVFYNV